MSASFRNAGFGLFVFAFFLVASMAALGAELVVEEDTSGLTLRVTGEEPFHTTEGKVAGARLLELPDGATRVVTWAETDADGVTTPYYALGLRGEPMGESRATSYVLKLLAGEFEPLTESVPAIEPALAAGQESNLYLVQFVTQPLEAYRDALRGLGAEIRAFMPHHAHIVEMLPAARGRVAALDFVRWIGPYHPAYRVEQVLRTDRETLERRFPTQRYNILLFRSSLEHKTALARRIEALGGTADKINAGKFLTVATLTAQQFLQVARWDEIAYIDRWSPLEEDMDIARKQGGADELETVAGYTGQGVRGESFDSGFNVHHPDFASRPPLEHGGTVGNGKHGTATLGVCFGDGTGDSKARGLLPDGQPIAADRHIIGMTGNDRYTHTGELREAPFFAVFQTSSVGNARTSFYTTISADHDTLLFDWDVLHCQSQSNAGDQESRPQAWAKNVVSGGGFRHYDTEDPADDCWCGGASIGPASDGRIKPDLSFYYDLIWTTYSTEDGYGEFSGTSGATPNICGHFGLFFQMFADGIFGNEVDPEGTVFDNRPHMTTAKAFMINTAVQHPFTGEDHDMTRVHQGWGMPNVKRLYDLREKITFVDETDILANTESVAYNVFVDPGEPALKITMTYADPAGNPASSIHRINDLSLRATSPVGEVYWGNNGLLENEWSVPGGAASTIDTVENVFVENPQAGMWVVQVTATEVIEDSHVETAEVDADFALVISGGLIDTCTADGAISMGTNMFKCDDEVTVRVADCDLNTSDETTETVNVTIVSDTEPEGETLLLTETHPASSTFVGTIELNTMGGPATLSVGDGDTVTSTYIDEDDGLGGTNVTKTATAQVDCVPPFISNVQATDIRTDRATVIFDTDEDARGTVRHGLSCADLDSTQRGASFRTSHSFLLTGLLDNTTYFYALDAVDEVGNSSTDDREGRCYPFTTEESIPPDMFTELFETGNDTDFLKFTFTPNGSPDYYAACSEVVSAFPTDPSGGSTRDFADDDSWQFSLMAGHRVYLYGREFAALYVASNGFLAFTNWYDESVESISKHFSVPRVSALFDDLDPELGGLISWKDLDDRAVVTWEAVPEAGTSNVNSFQIEMFYEEKITITLLNIDAEDGLIGLSQGYGAGNDFQQTDYSAISTCGRGVPGEAGVSPMLLVTGYDQASSVLSLTYGVPCAAKSHAIEYGELTRASVAGYEWSGQRCGIGISGAYDWNTFGALHDALFFVVVANNRVEEGSYGQASDGSERPEYTSSPTCDYPQNPEEACE